MKTNPTLVSLIVFSSFFVTLSCSKEDAPLPSYPNEIKVNGIAFSGTANGIAGFRDQSGGTGGLGLVQIGSAQGLSNIKQLGFSLNYTKYDDLTGTYYGKGGFTGQGELNSAGYQETTITGGLPSVRSWGLSEDVISTIVMNHLGNNRYQIGFDLYMEDVFDSLPDIRINGLYTATFTTEFTP